MPAARWDHELVDLGEVALKGIDAPWRVYAVPWEDGEEPLGLDERSPFVGREPERQSIQESLRGAVEGQGELILLRAGERNGEPWLDPDAVRVTLRPLVPAGQELSIEPLPLQRD